MNNERYRGTAIAVAILTSQNEGRHLASLYLLKYCPSFGDDRKVEV